MKESNSIFRFGQCNFNYTLRILVIPFLPKVRNVVCIHSIVLRRVYIYTYKIAKIAVLEVIIMELIAGFHSVADNGLFLHFTYTCSGCTRGCF
jgi:hypothetical protein